MTYDKKRHQFTYRITYLDHIDNKKKRKTFYGQSEKICKNKADEFLKIKARNLSKEKEEYSDRFFKGFNSAFEFKYTYSIDDKIVSYIKIKTMDNVNYFLDILLSSHDIDLYPRILSFAVKKIITRNKNFQLFIKNKKYYQTGEQIEEFFKENKFELLQNNAVLVRDFFKTVREKSDSFSEAVVFSGFEV